MKVLMVFGTRPEAIKMVPVFKVLKESSFFETKICVTGQHRSMLDQVLSYYAIEPHFDLNIMSQNQSLSSITQAVIAGLEPIFLEYQPQWVLVQGDTSTTFAASLAAFYHRIAIGHIEAGLRTYHRYSPYPEEINRQLTTRLADLHFAPTTLAADNLRQEGIAEHKICVTGNTVIDNLLDVKTNFQPAQIANWVAQFSFINPEKKLILMTSHRRENVGSGLQALCQAVKSIAERDDVQIIYPVHKNPQIDLPVRAMLGDTPNIFLIEPQDYFSFVYLMMQSYLILTDSGGVQEEAPALGKPVLVARDTTERQEGILAGITKLVGTSQQTIEIEVKKLLDDEGAYGVMCSSVNPYGDGLAAQRIVERLYCECTTH